MTDCYLCSLWGTLFSELNHGFSLSVKVKKFGVLQGGVGSNLCNTAVIFDSILKTINDHFVLISKICSPLSLNVLVSFPPLVFETFYLL